MSSKDTEWGTPHEFFDKINDVFGFNLDVCATDVNAMVEYYFSPEQDSLTLPWISPSVMSTDSRFGTVAWMNPPYGKGERACNIDRSKCNKKSCYQRGFHIDADIPGIGDWVNYGIGQVEDGTGILVSLLPARTDSEWFQSVWDHASLICFVRGRLKFVGAKDTAPFPSVISVFSNSELDDVVYEDMSSVGNVIDPREGQIIVYGGKR